MNIPDNLLSDLAKLAGGLTGFGVIGFITIRLLELYSNIGKNWEGIVADKDRRIAELEGRNNELEKDLKRRERRKRKHDKS